MPRRSSRRLVGVAAALDHLRASLCLLVGALAAGLAVSEWKWRVGLL